MKSMKLMKDMKKTRQMREGLEDAR